MKRKVLKFIDCVCILYLLFQLVFLILNWSKIPAEIPTHFDALGNPDKFGSKNSLYFIYGVSVFMFLSLSLVLLLPMSAWNMPAKVTAENAESIYYIMRYFMSFFKVILLFIFWYILHCSVYSIKLGAWFLPVTLILIFGSILFLIILLIIKSKNTTKNVDNFSDL